MAFSPVTQASDLVFFCWWGRVTLMLFGLVGRFVS